MQKFLMTQNNKFSFPFFSHKMKCHFPQPLSFFLSKKCFSQLWFIIFIYYITYHAIYVSQLLVCIYTWFPSKDPVHPWTRAREEMPKWVQPGLEFPVLADPSTLAWQLRVSLAWKFWIARPSRFELHGLADPSSLVWEHVRAWYIACCQEHVREGEHWSSFIALPLSFSTHTSFLVKVWIERRSGYARNLSAPH